MDADSRERHRFAISGTCYWGAGISVGALLACHILWLREQKRQAIRFSDPAGIQANGGVCVG